MVIKVVPYGRWSLTRELTLHNLKVLFCTFAFPVCVPKNTFSPSDRGAVVVVFLDSCSDDDSFIDLILSC